MRARQIIYLLIFFLTLSSLAAFSLPSPYISFPIFIVLSIYLTESCFNFLYKKKFQTKYIPETRLKSQEVCVEPHPHLPFVYKKHAVAPATQKTKYSISSDSNYEYPQLRTNNRRVANGPDGSRDVVIPKPRNKVRVSCLGDSVVSNYCRISGVNYSIPLLLEQDLADLDIEVNNCGVGGYTSLDILIKLVCLDTYEEPDILVLYAGYANIRSYLVSGFETDDSHFRKNVDSFCFYLKLSEYIPNPRLNFLNFIYEKIFPVDIGNNLLRYISKPGFDISNPFCGFESFENNIENVIFISKSRKIDLILCTCAHYLHPDISSHPSHLKFNEGVAIQNEIIKKLGQTHSIKVVDIANLLPMNGDNFFDEAHLTHHGMAALAQLISPSIREIVNRRNQIA